MSKQPKGKARVALPNLALWRAWRGMNGTELAKAAGLSRMTIFSLETGRAEANLVTVYKLARALGVSRKQLIEEEPPEEWVAQPSGAAEEQTEGRAVA